jgi:hypothetical protein
MLASLRRANPQVKVACNPNLHWKVEVEHSLPPTHRMYSRMESCRRAMTEEAHIALARSPIEQQGTEDLNTAMVLQTALALPWPARRSVLRSYYNTSLREQGACHIAYIYG